MVARRTDSDDALSPFQQLSYREREALGLVARGLTNGAIAQELDLSGESRAQFVSSILTKLPAATPAEAVARALDPGTGGRLFQPHAPMGICSTARAKTLGTDATTPNAPLLSGLQETLGRTGVWRDSV